MIIEDDVSILAHNPGSRRVQEGPGGSRGLRWTRAGLNAITLRVSVFSTKRLNLQHGKKSAKSLRKIVPSYPALEVLFSQT